MSRPIAAWALAGTLTLTSIAHLIQPGFFDGIVPSVLPNPRLWTYLSGLAELTVAGLVALPWTRRVGGLAAATLFVAVFPANIQMALDAHGASEQIIAWGRLPFQIPLVLWALVVYRQASVSTPGRTIIMR